jgi:hypothetical protein
MKDGNVCPNVPGQGTYDGWLNALYFASATLSTVGYGDVSIIGGNDTPRWRVFIGILYMCISVVVLVTAFSAAVEASATSPIDVIQDKIMNAVGGQLRKGELLYKRIRRVYALKLSIILAQFFALNLLGIFVARAFVNASDVEEEKWSWMTTFYWSVQTTTTIGVRAYNNNKSQPCVTVTHILPFFSTEIWPCPVRCDGSKWSTWSYRLTL